MRAALDSIEAADGVVLLKHTSFLETPPWGVEDQPAFLNAIAEVETTLGAHQLMALLKGIEVDLGRTRSMVRWGPREIDLDILIYGDHVIETEDLVVPHPRMLDRPFIVRQLVELDENIAHPTTSVRLRTVLGRI